MIKRLKLNLLFVHFLTVSLINKKLKLMEEEDGIKNIIEKIFNQGTKYSEKVINIDSKKKVQFSREKDETFIHNIKAIAEFSQKDQKKFFNQAAKLTDKQIDFIEKTGQLHYQANIYNDTSSKDPATIDPHNKCKCGCGRSKGKSLSFFTNQEEHAYFGQGIILYFFYTKKIIILISLVVLIYGVFSLVTNLSFSDTEQNCEKPGTFAFMCEFKVQSEISNKQHQKSLIIIQNWLGLLFCIVWTIGVRMIKKFGRKKGEQIDNLLDSSSDYCIWLQKLPIGDYTEKDILNYMQRLWKQCEDQQGLDLKIKSVQIVYNMEETRERTSEIQSYAKTLISCFKQHKKKKVNFFDSDYDKSCSSSSLVENQKKEKEYMINRKKITTYKMKKNRILHAYQELNDYRESFIDDEEFRSAYATQCAIVQFALKRQHEIFLEKYGMDRKTVVREFVDKCKHKLFKTDKNLQFEGRRIKILKAPEPSDIFWKHCEKKVRRRNTVIVWVISLILNLVTYAFLELVRRFFIWVPSVASFSILSVISINLFNRLIWNILLKVVFIEENYTKTANIMSVMNKSYISQSINNIVIPIITSYVTDGNIDGVTGLAGKIYDFQITSFFFMTLFNLVNIPHRTVQLIKCFSFLRRPLIKYLCKITGDFDSYSEMKEALDFLYEPPLVPVAGLYVYITSIIGQAMFFCYLQPVILFFLLGNLVMFYFMNRYLVLKMCKITDLLDISIFQTVVGFALNIPLIYGIGSIVLINIRGDADNFSFYVPSILCLIVWFIGMQNPFFICTKLGNCLSKPFAKKSITEQISDNLVKIQKKYSKNTMLFVNQIVNKQIEEYNVYEENVKKFIGSFFIKPISSRKESYYQGIGTNDLFNFQSKLDEVKGKFHGKNKQFCEKFNLGIRANAILTNQNHQPENGSQNSGFSKIIINQEEEDQSNKASLDVNILKLMLQN